MILCKHTAPYRLTDVIDVTSSFLQMPSRTTLFIEDQNMEAAHCCVPLSGAEGPLSSVVCFILSGPTAKQLNIAAFSAVLPPFCLLRSESVDELAKRTKMQQHEAREKSHIPDWPNVSWNVCALRLVTVKMWENSNEAPGRKQRGEETPADNTWRLQVGGVGAAGSVRTATALPAAGSDRGRTAPELVSRRTEAPEYDRRTRTCLNKALRGGKATVVRFGPAE